MKLLIATASIAAMAVASPALAQTNKGNEGIQSYVQQQRLDQGPLIKYGKSKSQKTHLGTVNKKGRTATEGRGPSRPVYQDGRYQGSDPDPRVRDQLRQDPPKSNSE